MVVFTCNHCGESLQKPKVEKHYNFACRKIKNLTCVDCFKDFKGEEYAVHTKCITEEERYAAKGTYASGIVKKGDVKQEAWVAHIRGIIEKEIGLKKPLKDLLITVSKHNNIPRKKRKFINYLTNSLGGRVNMKDIEAVWDIIEKHKDQENTAEATKTVVSTDNDTMNEQDSQEPPTKNKKKKKQNEELTTGEEKHIENVNDENIISKEDSQEPPAKKQKKKHNEKMTTGEQKHNIENENNENVITEIGNNESVINEENKQDSQEPPTKKKKKKKENEELITEQKHIENGNNENVITENGNNESVISEENKQDSQEPLTKKKKKKKQNDELITEEQQKHIENGNNKNVITENGNNESVINEENKQDSQESPTKKKKKKKQNEELITEQQKHIENDNNESVIMKNGENENTINDENKQELTFKKKKRKVDMTASSNETGMPEEKILKTDDYQANSNTETTNEEIMKFNMKGIILSILEKKGTISLKKLEKKVLSASKKAKGESDDLETVVKKIHKKLKRLPVQISEDQVCLVVE